MSATVSLVLHAHIPSAWDTQTAAHCALITLPPLLELIERTAQARLRLGLTLALSPSLIERLDRDDVRDAIEAKLRAQRDRTLDLSSGPHASALANLIEHDLNAASRRLEAFTGRWQRDLISALAPAVRDGRLGVMASPGTHALLPMMLSGALQATHVRVGLETVAARLQAPVSDLWLPHCAWSPELDPVLARCGVRATVVSRVGLQAATPEAILGASAPVQTPHGLLAFGLDPDIHGLGYARAFAYRARHHDGRLSPWCRQRPDGRPQGLYQPQRAQARLHEDALDFLLQVRARHDQAMHHRAQAVPDRVDAPVSVVLARDLIDLAHRWDEWTVFWEHVAQESERAGDDALTLATLGQHVRALGRVQVATPGLSSWHQSGFLAPWLDPPVDRLYSRLHGLERRLLVEVAAMRAAHGRRAAGGALRHRAEEDRGRGDGGGGRGHEAVRDPLERAALEALDALMTAQTSDHAPMAQPYGRAVDGVERAQSHIRRAEQLLSQLVEARVDPSLAAGLKEPAPLLERIFAEEVAPRLAAQRTSKLAPR